MPDPVSFEYAVVRVVPCVDRGEYINAGVILLCRERKYLERHFGNNTQRAFVPDKVVRRPRVCLDNPPIGKHRFERNHLIADAAIFRKTYASAAPRGDVPADCRGSAA